MNLRIDLNSDMGESFGAWKMGNDEAILPYVTSANIACGFHGGDPATMRKMRARTGERPLASRSGRTRACRIFRDSDVATWRSPTRRPTT